MADIKTDENDFKSHVSDVIHNTAVQIVQYMLTLQVVRYCLLCLQRRILQFLICCMTYDINERDNLIFVV